MARKRTPQTFEKRCRERDKQTKQQAKREDRRQRTAAKRQAKEDGPRDPDADISLHPDAVEQEPPARPPAAAKPPIDRVADKQAPRSPIRPSVDRNGVDHERR